MSLSQGDRLGRYEVLGPIGAGGMGEVWRARELLATLGVERCGLRVKDIAAEFDKSSEAASGMVSRGTEKRLGDKNFREEAEALDNHMVRFQG